MSRRKRISLQYRGRWKEVYDKDDNALAQFQEIVRFGGGAASDEMEIGKAVDEACNSYATEHGICKVAELGVEICRSSRLLDTIACGKDEG